MLGFGKKKPLPKRKYLTLGELKTRDLVARIAADLLLFDKELLADEAVAHAIYIVDEADRQVLEEINAEEGRI